MNIFNYLFNPKSNESVKATNSLKTKIEKNKKKSRRLLVQIDNQRQVELTKRMLNETTYSFNPRFFNQIGKWVIQSSDEHPKNDTVDFGGMILNDCDVEILNGNYISKSYIDLLYSSTEYINATKEEINEYFLSEYILKLVSAFTNWKFKLFDKINKSSPIKLTTQMYFDLIFNINKINDVLFALIKNIIKNFNTIISNENRRFNRFAFMS